MKQVWKDPSDCIERTKHVERGEALTAISTFAIRRSDLHKTDIVDAIPSGWVGGRALYAQFLCEFILGIGSYVGNDDCD